MTTLWSWDRRRATFASALRSRASNAPRSSSSLVRGSSSLQLAPDDHDQNPAAAADNVRQRPAFASVEGPCTGSSREAEEHQGISVEEEDLFGPASPEGVVNSESARWAPLSASVNLAAAIATRFVPAVRAQATAKQD